MTVFKSLRRSTVKRLSKDVFVLKERSSVRLCSVSTCKNMPVTLSALGDVMDALGEDALSMECVKRSDMFPCTRPVCDDVDTQRIPFPLLCGENGLFLGRFANGVITLTNFRLHICQRGSFFNIPLRLIESVDCRDLLSLSILCKDATTVKCSFINQDRCQLWLKRISECISPPMQLSDIFAFAFSSHVAELSKTPHLLQHVHVTTEPEIYTLFEPLTAEDCYSFGKELHRMQFDTRRAKVWRIMLLNEDYGVCQSYPKYHVVPADFNDDQMRSVAGFRSGGRFPSVVWRDRDNGAVIVRCSQPELGWLGWRNEHDELLTRLIPDACARDCPIRSAAPSQLAHDQYRSPSCHQAAVANGNDASGNRQADMLLVDCRSYSAAIVNRAKGGGCENPDYYTNCEIKFLNMANIHTVRKSLQALRLLCSNISDQSWLAGLEATKWLQHIANILHGARVVVAAIRDARPVLIHCSDGWDRTAQLSSLAQLSLDPFYRTVKGFYWLVEREWLQFGHKFADRCGHAVGGHDANEQTPVFLQWLDCVFQLIRQFPCHFQFNEAFLVKLAQHAYSCLFGTFLFNTCCERERKSLANPTLSIWPLLLRCTDKFRNPLYNSCLTEALMPECGLQNCLVWRSVYLCNSSLKKSDVEEFSTTLKKVPAPGICPSDVNGGCSALHDPAACSEEQNSSWESIAPSDDLPCLVTKEVDSSPRSAVREMEARTDLFDCIRNVKGLSLGESADVLLLGDGDLSKAGDSADTAVSNVLNSRNDGMKNCHNEGTGNCHDEGTGNCHGEGTGNYGNADGIYYAKCGKRDELDGKNHTARGTFMQDKHCSERMGRDCNEVRSNGKGGKCSEDSVVECADDEMNHCSPDASFVENKNFTEADDTDNVDGGNSTALAVRMPAIITSHCSSTADDPLSLSSGRRRPGRSEMCSVQVGSISGIGLDCEVLVVRRKKNLSLDIVSRRTPPLLTDSDCDDHPHSSHSPSWPTLLSSTDTLIGPEDFDGSAAAEDYGCYFPDLHVPVSASVDKNVASLCCHSSGCGDTLTPCLGLHDSGVPSRKASKMTHRTIGTSTTNISDSGVPRPSDAPSIGPARAAVFHRHPPVCDVGGGWCGQSVCLGCRKAKTASSSESMQVSCVAAEKAVSCQSNCVQSTMAIDGQSEIGHRKTTHSMPAPCGTGIGCHLDLDGLNTFVDPAMACVQRLVAAYQQRISELERQLAATLYHAPCTRPDCCGSAEVDKSLNRALQPDGQDPSTVGGAGSAPPSDLSWEQLDEKDQGVTLWVPDHAVNSCASCDVQFWIGRRRHHCRNCGRVYCGPCSNFFAPVISQHLQQPVRLCAGCYSNVGGPNGTFDDHLQQSVKAD